jgi:hypothetical protein
VSTGHVHDPRPFVPRLRAGVPVPPSRERGRGEVWVSVMLAVGPLAALVRCGCRLVRRRSRSCCRPGVRLLEGQVGGLDRLYRLHHWFGGAADALVVVHPVSLAWRNAMSSWPRAGRLWRPTWGDWAAHGRPARLVRDGGGVGGHPVPARPSPGLPVDAAALGAAFVMAAFHMVRVDGVIGAYRRLHPAPPVAGGAHRGDRRGPLRRLLLTHGSWTGPRLGRRRDRPRPVSSRWPPTSRRPATGWSSAAASPTTRLRRSSTSSGTWTRRRPRSTST